MYAELHCLSNFSFLRGASRPEELVERARALGYAALALTDECSMAGVVRAHEAAREHGLALVVGTEVRLDDGPKLVLLACNRAGYGRLSALVTLGRRRAGKGRYRLTRADLEAGLADCLALLVPGEAVPAPESALWLKDRFPGRCWLAVELHRGPDDAARLAAMLALARAAGIPALAAGDVHMHARGRRALQDTVTAIRLGTTVDEAGTALFPNGERHLRPIDTLRELYPPALLRETLAAAARCRFSLDELRYEYPDELVPAGTTPASHLAALTEAGLARRYPRGAPPKVRAQVRHELSLIHELAYEPYFLTVHDIVAWAQGEGILCQGRGSAANSAVCYALGITEVDPAASSMLFERFISKERNEPPDIDVDFEHERREEVIQRIYAKYGRERAALAATVICYRPKSALRDVGKALGFDLDHLDRLSRNLAWWDGAAELPQRLAESGFDAASPRVRKLLALARSLLGFPRHLSQHVGGFVISRGPLSELVPVENAAMPERTVIQWDKDDLDALGLLKVDVLALGMLTAIRKAMGMLPAPPLPGGEGPGERARHLRNAQGAALRLQDIPREDPAVYDMLCKADSVGVFQVESRAQMSMLPRLAPRCFYDLVIEVAIVRPGPIQGGMVHPYLARRRTDPAHIDYPSQALKAVLERTLGVPIFQEQVMQIAVVAAGFTPGEADGLRRSMAAWRRRGGVEHWERRLKEGMRERGYTDEFAESIYQQILGFGEYGFPESHAASFALLVYVSAWLKRHHPAAFLCGLLNAQPMGFYAPAQLIQDARRHGVQVLPVDVAASQWDCTLADPLPQRQAQPASPPPGGEGTASPPLRGVSGPLPHSLSPGERGAAQSARLGLRMIAGFNLDAAARIVAARAQRPFEGVDDLAARARLNRKEIRLLAGAGALKSLAGHRRQAWWAAAAQRPGGVLHGVPVAEPGIALPPPTEGQDLVADYARLGFTLGRHPLALLRRRLEEKRFLTAQSLNACPDRKLARAAGLVTCRQHPSTAQGVVFVTLEDETGNANVIVHPRLLETQRRELLSARLLGVYGQLQREGEVVHLIAKRLVDLSPLLGRLPVESRDFR